MYIIEVIHFLVVSDGELKPDSIVSDSLDCCDKKRCSDIMVNFIGCNCVYNVGAHNDFTNLFALYHKALMKL